MNRSSSDNPNLKDGSAERFGTSRGMAERVNNFSGEAA